MAGDFIRANPDSWMQAIPPGSGMGAYPLTMMFWGNCDNSGGSVGNTGLYIGENSANNENWTLTMEGTNDRCQFKAISGGTGDEVIGANEVWSLNTWTHVCGVGVAANDRSLYVHGRLDVRDTASSSTPDDSLMDTVGVGCLIAGAIGNGFSGGIAEAAIWDVALVPAEIAFLARGNSPDSLTARRRNLVYYADLRHRAFNAVDPVPPFGQLYGYGAGEPGIFASHPKIVYPPRRRIYSFPSPVIGLGWNRELSRPQNEVLEVIGY